MLPKDLYFLVLLKHFRLYHFYSFLKQFQAQFDPLTDGNDIILNLDRTRTVDISAVDALNELAYRYSKLGQFKNKFILTYLKGKQLHVSKAKRKTENMIAALKRDCPSINQAVEFDKIPSNNYIVDYNPERFNMIIPLLIVFK